MVGRVNKERIVVTLELEIDVSEYEPWDEATQEVLEDYLRDAIYDYDSVKLKSIDVAKDG